jgi:hypothetical protein
VAQVLDVAPEMFRPMLIYKAPVLHGKIRTHMSVQPKDVLESVDLHLNNIAIRSEIEMARETYERSKMFLAGHQLPHQSTRHERYRHRA